MFCGANAPQPGSCWQTEGGKRGGRGKAGLKWKIGDSKGKGEGSLCTARSMAEWYEICLFCVYTSMAHVHGSRARAASAKLRG